MELAGILKKHIEKLNPIKVCIDVGGGGVGVYDRLCELFPKHILELVHFNGKALDSMKYYNRRDQMWGELAEFIKKDGYIVFDDTLLQQISNIEYSYNSLGQLKIESKDEIKKRLKASPDGGDACALTFAGERKIEIQMSKEEFNPFVW
ncbi:MAG: hypothetical protein LBH40_04170 [Alphaproteobacteria bacterium]|jgi:hypothetical protein|nr:hypothetical protein [Alphaproteobacteria bacterium]